MNILFGMYISIVLFVFICYISVVTFSAFPTIEKRQSALSRKYLCFLTNIIQTFAVIALGIYLTALIDYKPADDSGALWFIFGLLFGMFIFPWLIGTWVAVKLSQESQTTYWWLNGERLSQHFCQTSIPGNWINGMVVTGVFASYGSIVLWCKVFGVDINEAYK